MYPVRWTVHTAITVMHFKPGRPVHRISNLALCGTIQKRCTLCEKTITRSVLRLVWPSLLLLFIEPWRYLADRNDPNFINKNVFKNVIGSLGDHHNLSHCWHHGARHTCKVCAEQYGDMSSDGHKKHYIFLNLIGSLGYHQNLTHCWHHGTRHTCKVS